MCIQFNAVKIIVTTGPANMVGHDGVMSVNEDCPVGTVLCYDKDDNLYYLAVDDLGGLWRESKLPTQRKRIRLYRDYWRHIQSGPNTPYGASFRNAPHKVVEEVA